MADKKPNKKISSTLSQTKDIVNAKWTFSTKEIIGIALFLLQALVTISMGVHFYLKTAETVSELNDYRKDHEKRLSSLETLISNQTGEINSFRLMLVNVFKPLEVSQNKAKGQ